LIIFTFGSTFLYAQDWSRYGHKSFKEKDYYGASYYFQLASQSDSIDLDILWFYAESNRLSNQYKKAGAAYNELMEIDENINYPKAIFFRADMLKRLEQYEEAASYFNFFRDVYEDKRDLLYKRAKIEIQACEMAKANSGQTELLEIKHPPYGVNSFDAEFSPRILNDTHILFSALRFDTNQTKNLTVSSDQFRTIIYEGFFVDSMWTIQPLSHLINDSLTNNANPVITPDSSQMYFTRCDEKGCAIYVSNWYEDHWENAVKLGPNINSENTSSTHPFVTNIDNGKTYLFFSSNRPRTRGKMDIWSVEIKNNGSKYGRAKNAGRNVNTKEDEITPYFDTTDNHLYFSSIYHPGYGGFDIFKARGLPGKFNESSNLGKPLNSSANDMYFSYSDTLKKGSFISNRKDGYALKGETCCNDIYFFGPQDTNQTDSIPVEEIPIEEDLVVKLASVQFLPLALYFDNDKPNSNSKSITTEKTYQETFESYLDRKSIFLKKAPSSTKIDSFFIQNVEVGFTKLQMLADSLEKYLEKGYKLQLGIKGFTSPLGDADYNDHLALRRISSIENYLYHCNNGALQTSIDSGLLKFRQIPFGEFFSLGNVSDDYNSQRQSVYSSGASEARKVEIIWVEQTLPGDSNAIVIFEKTTHNFHTLPPNKIVEHRFKFTNTGENPLIINSIETDCDCLTAFYPTVPIEPGESNEVLIKFNTSGRKGLQFHGLVIQTNAKIPEKKLFIRGIMENLIAP
jgi:tetratricopeptide (TPR) repeat protein